MSLVTYARYVAITGDDTSASASVEGWLADSTARLEDDLGRPLEEAERTETLWPDRAGDLYPAATPISAAEGWTVRGGTYLDGGSYLFGFPWPWRSGDPVDVTYTGGFVERTANPDATNRLPVSIERDIAWVAYAFGHAGVIASGLPAGATSASVGDVSVSFGPSGASASTDDLTIRWSRATLRHRHRRV